MTTRGTLLLEVERSLRVVAQEATQLVVLPRLASSEPHHATETPSLSLASREQPRAAA
jgi:hypothetical protein